VVKWLGGFQHNGNNPEVIDTLGRSYSSRAIAPGAVGFVRDGSVVPQHVFSSNKNMTGRAVAQSILVTNPGTTELRLNASVSVTDPRNVARVSQLLTIPAGGSVRVGVANTQDKGFIAFKATLEPADKASMTGKVHVDVVAHDPSLQSTASELASQPLMRTEAERGYRIPVSRLAEHPHYLRELRFVMKAARVTPDPFSQSDAQVTQWAREQATLGSQGRPTAFSPVVNRGILSRVNGLVGATAGEVQAAPLVVSAAGANSLVRVRPNAQPPELIASRPGTSVRDHGAYGKRITTTIPLRNDSGAPVRLAVRLETPPEGQDGAQMKGHQSYNGPVILSATGGTLSGVKESVRLGQPGGLSSYARAARIAIVTVPPHASINLRVGLETHANSQFPLDIGVSRL
jgi:hypothetical protein